MPVLYSAPVAPSPRRVRIFLAEKGIEVPTQDVDLASGEQFSADFRRHNPDCTVPALVLEDGTCIGDSDAICLYFETLHPEPPLMGTDALTRAQVRAWDRWVEGCGYSAVAEGLRNSAPRFEGRALPGPHRVEQIPALVDRARQRYADFLSDLEARLQASEFVALDRFTVADITALVTVDFGRRVLRMEPGGDQAALQAWYQQVSNRASAAA